MEYQKQFNELRDKGLHQEIIALANKIICDVPDWHMPYEELGDSYLTLGELDKAEKALVYALKLYPKSVNGNYLFGFLLGKTNDLWGSIEHLSVANEGSPDNPEIERNLGWAKAMVGKQEEGIALLEKALAKCPTDTWIMADLGVVLLRASEFDKGIEIFEKALRFDPENEKFKEYIETAKFFKLQYELLDTCTRERPPSEVFSGPPPEELPPILK